MNRHKACIYIYYLALADLEIEMHINITSRAMSGSISYIYPSGLFLLLQLGQLLSEPHSNKLSHI